MEDLAAKLSELLESPEGLENIKSMADMLLGSSAAQTEHTSDTGDTGILGAISPSEIQSIMKIMGALKSGGDDDRTRLLLALRPHLSEERKPRVDRAIKLLKIAGVLPMLGETNLLDLF